ncbi:MAG TPA: YggS family pyridoxal phosphate enzyme [Acidimicrobiales bacterium]|nr:YggS family pyridoxal phosphate enzyme [Acidimicrobiales bacterium]
MTTAASDTVTRNLAGLRARIERAGGDADRVTIVAVTKQQPDTVVGDALAAGLRDLGENRTDALVERATAQTDAAIRWHFLGQIQRNKIGKVAPHVALWQSVDRPELGPAIAKHAPGARVLVEVNLTDDPNRGGTSLVTVPSLVSDLTAEGLVVLGLMAVGPIGDAEVARPGFSAITRMADSLGLAVRSFGMSNDVEVAVECGSTMVRVGTGLFGARAGHRDFTNRAT